MLGRDGVGFADINDPRAGRDEVVVRTAAAGLCHSDLVLAARPPDQHPFGVPFALGHELAGTVVELGEGVRSLEVGDEVVGYGPRGCGRCGGCASGAENYCRSAPTARPPGLGSDGALAEYVVVSARHLLSSAGVAAAQAAALSDAGLTSYHALGRAIAMAGRPADDLTIVVIGIGGLGHLAVRLAARRGARVIAVERQLDKRELAASRGADEVLDDGADTAAAIADLTSGRGCDIVLDFVARQSTFALGRSIVARDGVISIVGVGTDRLEVGMHALPLGVRTDLPFWGTRVELSRVLELARRGVLDVEVEEHGFPQTPMAYERLAAGEVMGRAVVRMDR